MSKPNWKKIKTTISRVYPDYDAEEIVAKLQKIVFDFRANDSSKLESSLQAGRSRLKQNDAALICYANNIETSDKHLYPLQALKALLLELELPSVLSIIHLLPFYPWDTDRGFSVKDYREVHPDYGTWDDIKALSQDFELMFDFVANHASIKNPLIQGALIAKHLPEKDPRYKDYSCYKNFVLAFDQDSLPSQEDLDKLTRPRPNPVLSPYTVYDLDGKLSAELGTIDQTRSKQIIGQGYVWTTFSRPQNADGSEATKQVDLNFNCPEILIEAFRILLFYASNGATLIRLDAIGYIWKRLGSNSLHEPEAHLILEILNDLTSLAAPNIVTIAEINEPQEEVFKYLGFGAHEQADLVYQFTHFPLALHAVLTENASFYKKWIPSTAVAEDRQFITVLGSHDGLGLKPIRGILPDHEISKLEDILLNQHGGLANYAKLAGGKEIVYEICGTPWNLINNPNDDEPLEVQLRRYAVVLALGLGLRGLPGIYINGLFASTNYLPQEGLDENRTINREVFDLNELEKKLKNPNNQMARAFKLVQHLLNIRSTEPSFNPFGPPVEVLELDNNAVIASVLRDPGEASALVSLVNVKNQIVAIEGFKIKKILGNKGLDLISNKFVEFTETNLSLEPYQVLWLKS